MRTCVTGKRCFVTHELAEEALIGAHVNHSYNKGNGPIGVYACDECGQFHLTSKGEMNKRLAEMLKDGEIQKQKEVNWWEQKFRRR